MIAHKEDFIAELKWIDGVQFIVIDLFCGAGGTTTGFEDAQFEYSEMLAFLDSVGISAPDTLRELYAKMAMVVACVNHDPIAIKSHWQNHKHVYHFEEDITLLYGAIRHGILFKSPQFQRLIRLIDLYRAFYPGAKIILWASLECTNFSKAKGGKPRDADSRTLAEHLHPYIVALDPDYIKIENVVEFMSWGPLDAKGKPISKKNGQDWLRWRKSICDLGYRDEWRELNSADFGALTSRNRLFGCFAKPDMPIVWPEPTHSKKPEKTSIYKPLLKWEPVKKALDFSDEGRSVFNRFKRVPKVKASKQGYLFCKLNAYDEKEKTFGPIPDRLSPKTMQRLFMGCVKHVAGGKQAFLSKAYSGKPVDKNVSLDQPAPTITTIPHEQLVFITKWNSNNKKTGGHPGHSVEEPCPVVSTQNRLGAAFIVKGFSSHSGKSVNSGSSIELPFPTITTQGRERLASVDFISRYNGVNGGKHHNSRSVDQPIGALGTGDNQAKVTAQFLNLYYGGGGQQGSIESPAGTIPTRDRLAKVQAEFFVEKQYKGENHQSIEQPSGSILPVDKHRLVKAEKWLMSTNFNNIGSSVDEPSPTLTADRHAHYIINPSWGGHSGSIEDPCHVVIARQDKAPLYLITTIEHGPVVVPVYSGDCEWTIRLKEFMALFGIVDIKMRMLKILELLVIQGFPIDYILCGSQEDQKKFIGNSVHPKVPKFWIQAKSNKFLKAAA